MKIKGAIFDMDGTLVESLGFWEILWRRMGEKYMGSPDFLPDDETEKKVRTTIYAGVKEYLYERFEIKVDKQEFFDFCEKTLDDFYQYEVTVKPGAIEFLEELKRNGIPMCIASAGDMKRLKPTVEALGLSKYISLILSCADIGKGKEHPDIYYLAKEKLGCDTAELCVFEDSFVALETAKKAGFHTVGLFDRFNPGQDRLEAASEIYLGDGHTMAELVGVIEF